MTGFSSFPLCGSKVHMEKGMEAPDWYLLQVKPAYLARDAFYKLSLKIIVHEHHEKSKPQECNGSGR